MGEEDDLAFHEMGLDDRILKAVAKNGWSEPTAIQEKAIPLILEGRDVLARGRTGSGKTGAFALPAIQKVLTTKTACQMGSTGVQAVRVLIMAPTRELAKQIQQVLQELTSSCGRVVRSVDVSDRTKALEDQKALLVGQDKFILVYALFKLKLVRGKSIIFVNSVDKCYRIKLYLEQFGIPVCVLNSELPNSTRCHIVTQFNKGIYEVIVASDEKFLDEGQPDEVEKKTDKDKAKSKRKKDTESGVSRGIDFQFVSNIINFDFPNDTDSYIHRVGRTARGNNKGTALSLVAGKEKERAEAVDAALSAAPTAETPADQTAAPSVFKPYKFRMEELDGFRYRAMDAWRAVTRIAIREARLKEIKQEMLNSNKLQSHFADNPRDLQSLRHDKALHTVRHQAHLKNVPNYIVPQTLRKLNATSSSAAADKKRKGFKKGAGVGGGHKTSAAKRKFHKQQGDALRGISKR